MTAATADSPQPGRKRFPWVLLALSLSLNLFFVAGATWIRMHHRPEHFGPAARMRFVATELNLDVSHRREFDRYLRTLRARLRLLHAEVRPIVREAWAELARPNADEAQVMQLFDEASAKRRAFREELTRSTLRFLATLTPQQREKFVDLARQRPKPYWRRPASAADAQNTTPSGPR